jgi:hypothetical protein
MIHEMKGCYFVVMSCYLVIKKENMYITLGVQEMVTHAFSSLQ